MDKISKQIKDDFVSAIKESGSKGTSPYDTQAEVVRVDDDGTAWVHIPGGVEETPARMTISCKPGDTVQLRVGGGSAWLVGNQTAPPTDDSQVEVVKERTQSAIVAAHNASETASNAQSTADSANTAAVNAQSTANGAATAAGKAQESVDTLETMTDKAITFDTSYTFSTTDGTETANFEAHVYRYGEDVTSEYADSCFSWWRKLEGERTSGDMTRFATGKTCTVSLADCGYGATVVGQFETVGEASLLTTSSARLQTLDAVPLTAAASGESVRVSDLPTGTPQSDDWLMGWSAASTYRATVANVLDAALQIATKSEIEGILV